MAEFERPDGGVEGVRAAVAHHADAEVPPAAPDFRMIGGVVGPMRGRTEPEVPVEFVRKGRGVGGPGSPLGTPGGMAPGVVGKVAPGIDLADLADGAVPNPFADEADAFAGVALVAHLSGEFALARGLGQGAGLVDIVSERFLEVNVFAGLEGGQGDDGMGVVGRGDHDRLDVLLFIEHLAVVGPDSCLGIFFEDFGGVVVVHVAQGDDVLGVEVFEVGGAHAADADAGDVEFFARAVSGRRRGHGAAASVKAERAAVAARNWRRFRWLGSRGEWAVLCAFMGMGV